MDHYALKNRAIDHFERENAALQDLLSFARQALPPLNQAGYGSGFSAVDQARFLHDVVERVSAVSRLALDAHTQLTALERALSKVAKPARPTVEPLQQKVSISATEVLVWFCLASLFNSCFQNLFRYLLNMNLLSPSFTSFISLPLQAHMHRFDVIKINSFNKDTPRLIIVNEKMRCLIIYKNLVRW
jgi:hypothetical protein